MKKVIRLPTFQAKQESTILLREDDNWLMSFYHFHDFLELSIALSDSGHFLIGEKLYPIQHGRVFYLNTMDFHRSVSETLYKRYVIHFSADLLNGLSTEEVNLLEFFSPRPVDFNHSVVLNPKQLESALEIIERSIELMEENKQAKDIYMKLMISELLLLINPLFKHQQAMPMEPTTYQFAHIMPIISYIQNHLEEDLSLDFLAQQFYLNKYYLSKLFKKSTGYGVTEYIIHMRILKARELLRKNHSVQQVGEMVGFNNNCHFIRTFTKLIGISPKQYSKQVSR